MKKTAVILTLLAGVLYAAPLKTATAQEEPIGSDRAYAATVYSHQETMIATRVMGYIKAIRVEEGDRVRKDQVLFEVDPSDVESMTAQAEAGALSAKSQYLDAQRDFERFADLYEKGVVPKRDYEKMQLNLDLRAQGLKMAEAALEQAKAQIKYATVRSPIDGVVIAKMSKVAELAAPGRPVLVVSSLDSLRARALVQESEIGQVRVGQRALVEVSALGQRLEGSVISVVPSGDAATHSYEIRVSLPKSEGLLPGMYAKIALQGASRKGVTVPLSALTDRGGISGVFALEGNTARFVPVTVKTQLGGRVEVAGVAPGTVVIEHPGVGVQDGKPVK